MDLAELRTERFFEDKNRAFWILQATGWGAYFVVRALGGLANAMGLVFFVPTLISTTTGFSLTLLMAAVYRRVIKMPPMWVWTVSKIGRASWRGRVCQYVLISVVRGSLKKKKK